MTSIDFHQLNQHLLESPERLLVEWLPGGRLVRDEYTCASLTGGHGNSLKVNTESGLWADFATGESGSDLVSLYAAIKNLGQVPAARELADNFSGVVTETKIPPRTLTQKPTPTPVPLTPFPHVNFPLIHSKLGKPTHIHTYRNKKGKPVLLIARYESHGGGKSFFPWIFRDGNPQCKQAPEPRPLYNLDGPTRDNVLIVEGEKCADAAIKLAGHNYQIHTWPGGSSAVKKVDWSHVYGKRVLIWPDNDDPGFKCAGQIAHILNDHCPEVKILDVKRDKTKPKSFDVADFEGTYSDFLSWARGIARVVPKQSDAPVAEPKPKPKPKPQKKPPVVRDNMFAIYQELNLEVQDRSGKPINNTANASKLFEFHPALKEIIWYDEFSADYFIRWPGEKARPINEQDHVKLLVFAQTKCRFATLSQQNLDAAIIYHASKNRRNECAEYIKSLTWDGVDRLAHFFHEYYGAEDNLYTQQVGQNFWVSMVARACNPGCKADNMVILEGGQGKYKSTSLEIIGGKWYRTIGEEFGSKDFYLKLQGCLLAEVEELASMNKSEVNEVKKSLSQRHDVFRPPYGKKNQEFPRKSIFVGTTNDSTYLRDSTGSRRFWPVKIIQSDVHALHRDRDQLFAQAHQLFIEGTKWHHVDEKLAIEVQQDKFEYDAWYDTAKTYIDLNRRLNTTEFLTAYERTGATSMSAPGIGMEMERIGPRETRRISSIMKTLGCVQKRLDGKRYWVYECDL